MRATAIAKGLSPYLTVEALKTRIGSAAIKRSEELHVHPANQLQITLQHLKLFPTPELKLGDLLPPIYHFLYFLPRLTENQLSSDGGDPTFNAGGDFVRRMWAGGDFAWVTSNPLRFGQTVTETTELESATAKITKSGKSMIVVSAKKEYSNEKGLALTERRQWLFREAVSNAEVITDRTQASTQQDTLLVPGKKLGTMTASEVLLFRFSALTFNSHHIHYNKDALAKEGHPDLVVHGPLNVLLLANAYREQSRHALSSMTYRAQSPVYVHQPYSLYLDGQKVQAVSDATNKVIMSADVLCDSGKHGTVSTSS